MTLTELIGMTRVYARDNNSFMFTDANITMFLNQAIDRLMQYPIFKNMPYLSIEEPNVYFLPKQYHYILALFASARCFDTDERFYEGTEKRNEFEQFLDNMIAEIESGNLIIYGIDGITAIENTANYMDYVTDTYYGTSTTEEEGV